MAEYASEHPDIEVLFVTSGSDFKKTIEARGFRDIVLGTAYDCMDGEIERFISVLSEAAPDVVIIDSYCVTEKYFTVIQSFCNRTGAKVVYIDDMLCFAYSCDYILNYDILVGSLEQTYRRMYTEAGISLPKLLLGPRFAPLRKEFSQCKRSKIREAGKDILITTGGADSYHVLLGLTDEIISRGDGKHIFHLIIGACNPDSHDIRRKAETGSSIVVYENITNMGEIMEKCDVAISASGSTLFELCATRTPSVIYTIADNQLPGAKGFSKKGLMEYCGDIRDYSMNEMAKLVLDKALALADNYEGRMMLFSAMKETVDGLGADRILTEICRQ